MAALEPPLDEDRQLPLEKSGGSRLIPPGVVLLPGVPGVGSFLAPGAGSKCAPGGAAPPPDDDDDDWFTDAGCDVMLLTLSGCPCALAAGVVGGPGVGLGEICTSNAWPYSPDILQMASPPPGVRSSVRFPKSSQSNSIPLYVVSSLYLTSLTVAGMSTRAVHTSPSVHFKMYAFSGFQLPNSVASPDMPICRP